ncbi:translesion error-prone DNA polymerase V autoproteolytic subunit (plasmid) [Franconibacter helveticus 513]|uniref:translesion error-prone DNA polymerase V autoproteolytic subunit n=1 Tax=Franconibacter helveticus TaxID=357240 RepID=UPI00040B9A47|nr:translesion error-prone DNA polymerase V autoproteolytic subunit [Franconibacter helveticus]ELQ6035277.1 translesion error-prone DNA polymerase V autoproteolytic subunit [Cronobacter sakazakii]HBI11510.1 peptidase [Franconibacter pulveris]ELQ6043813.1 translesion error-prone DNA polymerase V autoproteolytic subunit [Cronobacter sakazakii]ELQ6086324.1 translesion error-prone DNA polymerase V autoproteolytic subunit [Cronobacter sakazakii]ELQ6091058.1 translesion error-prone DNA polymerase V 
MILEIWTPPENCQVVAIPLFTERASCGFPSPAQDYVEAELDLNEYCIRRRSSTFFVRAIGNSMRDIGLHSGDLLVVDKAEKPQHGDIVIAEINGEFTVKRLLLRPRPALQAMNPDYGTLYPDPEQLQIFGVVTHFVHRTRENG